MVSEKGTRHNVSPGGLQMAAISPQPSFLATRRGKLTLALLCAVAFLDFVDASIVNVALPSIQRACPSPFRACNGYQVPISSHTAGSCWSAAVPLTCSAGGAC